jgi:hypothetical protein
MEPKVLVERKRVLVVLIISDFSDVRRKYWGWWGEKSYPPD